MRLVLLASVPVVVVLGGALGLVVWSSPLMFVLMLVVAPLAVVAGAPLLRRAAGAGTQDAGPEVLPGSRLRAVESEAVGELVCSVPWAVLTVVCERVVEFDGSWQVRGTGFWECSDEAGGLGYVAVVPSVVEFRPPVQDDDPLLFRIRRGEGPEVVVVTYEAGRVVGVSV